MGIVGVDGLDADTGTLVTRSPSGDVSEVEVGSLPDMLTFTHDAASADGLPLKHGG